MAARFSAGGCVAFPLGERWTNGFSPGGNRIIYLTNTGISRQGSDVDSTAVRALLGVAFDQAGGGQLAELIAGLLDAAVEIFRRLLHREVQVRPAVLIHPAVFFRQPLPLLQQAVQQLRIGGEPALFRAGQQQMGNTQIAAAPLCGGGFGDRHSDTPFCPQKKRPAAAKRHMPNTIIAHPLLPFTVIIVGSEKIFRRDNRNLPGELAGFQDDSASRCAGRPVLDWHRRAAAVGPGNFPLAFRPGRDMIILN